MPPSNSTLVPDEHVPLRDMSTMGVGGPARWFTRAVRVDDVAAAHRWCLDRNVPLFVLGGGSNLLIADQGFDGLVLRIELAGVTTTEASGVTLVTAGAGEVWDHLVEALVRRRLSGVECLSGIPGTVGGTPIQNVGAYGQEVATTIERVQVFDRLGSTLGDLPAAECGFAYRTSRFKAADAGRFVVCGVTLRMTEGPATAVYPDLVTELRARAVSQPGVTDVRDAVLAIRRRKGMVLDASDPDTRSVGSFFMNPVIASGERDALEARAGAAVPGYAVGEERVKIPAAWLIERAGLRRGPAGGAVGLSTKHPLAIANFGGATTRDVLRFAVRVKRAVADWCGIWLQPEPVFVGLDGDSDVEFLRKARD